MTYTHPEIVSGPDAARSLRDLKGRVAVATMEIPWETFQRRVSWSPDILHMVTDMDEATLEAVERDLPPCDIVVGLGGGSCVDTAKYIAWRRGCRMVLVPTITSVDAPFTNMVAVRVGHSVRYVGDRYPEHIIVDYGLIREAPKVLNRAGACDIASIHTALHDWRLAAQLQGEPYDEAIAQRARQCLLELDRNASEVYDVTRKGIDTLVELYCREVAFCAELGNSRPEEGSEHLVAYHLEHLTHRHFLHGDLVGLGIFCMARLQANAPEWAADLLVRTGLRFQCPDATRDEVRTALRHLREFKQAHGLFLSVVDTEPITEDFVQDTLAALYDGW